MKTIQNIETSLLNRDGKKYNYIMLCVDVICVGTPQGLGIKEMDERLRVKHVIEANSDAKSFDLEEADFNKLVECLEIFKWSVPQEDFSKFHHYIIDLASAVDKKKV